MRLKKKLEVKQKGPIFGNNGNSTEETQVEETTISSTREARYRIYSCAFCEFVRDNISDFGDENVVGEQTEDVFEAKYLYHLLNVHGLER